MVLSSPFRSRVLLSAIAMSVAAANVGAKTVYLDMDVELDQVAPEDLKMYRVGGHDLDRIAYDDSTRRSCHPQGQDYLPGALHHGPLDADDAHGYLDT